MKATHFPGFCELLTSKSRVETGQFWPTMAMIAVHFRHFRGTGERLHTIYDPFMVIEAKRLPAPTSDREREYVTGKDKSSGRATGGIQRFKLGLHGAGNEIAAIVEYVQKHSVQTWFGQINQWISDLATSNGKDGCVWSNAEKLQELEYDNTRQTATNLHHGVTNFGNAVLVRNLPQWAQFRRPSGPRREGRDPPNA